MSAPRALVVQHQPEAPAGRFGDWADARGIALDVVLLAAGERLPAPGGFDCAVVLGWEASVAGALTPAAAVELEWLRAVDAAGAPVLGICFGSQALARALGGAVEPSPDPEVGWITIEPAPGSGVPAGPWFTWHDDSFSLPPGGEALARGGGHVQAFALGAHLGVQFHPEVTPAIVEGWKRMGDRGAVAEASPERFVRPAGAAQDAEELAFDLFDYFAGRAGLPLS